MLRSTYHWEPRRSPAGSTVRTAVMQLPRNSECFCAVFLSSVCDSRCVCLVARVRGRSQVSPTKPITATAAQSNCAFAPWMCVFFPLPLRGRSEGGHKSRVPHRRARGPRAFGANADVDNLQRRATGWAREAACLTNARIAHSGVLPSPRPFGLDACKANVGGGRGAGGEGGCIRGIAVSRSPFRRGGWVQPSPCTEIIGHQQWNAEDCTCIPPHPRPPLPRRFLCCTRSASQWRGRGRNAQRAVSHYCAHVPGCARPHGRWI